MVQERNGARLSTQEKGRLRQMIRSGRSSAQIAADLDVSERIVFRAERQYAGEGLDEVLQLRNQVNRATGSWTTVARPT